MCPSGAGKGATDDDPVRFRFHPGRQGSKRSARREGRQPRRDDQIGSARAARVHHHHRGLPGIPGTRHRTRRTAGAGDDGAAAPGGQPRQAAGRPARPAAGERAFRREILDARNDGNRAEHRPERCQRQGPRRGIRRRAFRLGFLPPVADDVRQDRAGHARRRFRRRAGQGEVHQGRAVRHRTRRRRHEGAGRGIQGRDPRELRPGIPAAPARATRHVDPRGLQLLEHQPRPAVPASGTDPSGPGHRRQHLHHGVRQPRREQRHRRRFHP